MAAGSWDDSWIAWSFSPSISAILVTLFISLASPILFHYFLVLYIQHDRRRLPANDHAFNHQLVILSDMDHEHFLHKRLRAQVRGLDRHLRQLLWRVLRRVPWQADADIHADRHMHSASGSEWILESSR